jgi:hypothetical protein
MEIIVFAVPSSTLANVFHRRDPKIPLNLFLGPEPFNTRKLKDTLLHCIIRSRLSTELQHALNTSRKIQKY